MTDQRSEIAGTIGLSASLGAAAGTAEVKRLGVRGRCSRWGLAGGTIVVALLVLSASPAAAHTSLVTSSPADGEIIERAPDSLELTFAAPVDVDTLQLRLQGADGTAHGTLGVDGPGSSTEMRASLPELDPGAYVITWVSIGDDGHRATGEIVFGIGAVGIDSLRAAAGGSDRGDPYHLAGSILRWGTSVALAFAAGGLLAAAWSRRTGRGPAGDVLGPLGRRLVRRGVVVAALGLGGRALVVLWSTADLLDGGIGGRLRSAWSPTVGTASIAAVAALVGAAATGRVARRGAPPLLVDRLWALLVVVLAIGGASLGHAGASDAGAIAVLAAGLHGVAAAVWVGPLLVAAVLWRARGWRALDGEARSAILRGAGRAFAPIAGGAFVALAGTGPFLLLLDASWSELASSFKSLLAVKLVLIALVVLPLGFVHDRTVGWLAARRGHRRPAALGWTFALESLALLAVVAGGVGLASADPRQPPMGSDLLAEVDDPAQCADLVAGALSCYRRYFTGVLTERGPDEAATELDRLSGEVAAVGSECHQLAHDLGNDAVAVLGGIGPALAQAPPTCWSGYYHGVVELAVSQLDDDPSGAELASTCEVLARAGRYNFPHYNCVHGLGHGVMLLTDHRLQPALALCERVEDEWERSSCLGGVFMERVISIQASPVRDDAGDDLLYPCSVVAEDQLDECFQMQSSYFLWRLDWDYAAGFALCDAAPDSAIDVCYRSMGRDIGSRDWHEPAPVAEHCALGSTDRTARCVEGAAMDAHVTLGPSAGEQVCAVLPDVDALGCVDLVRRTLGPG